MPSTRLLVALLASPPTTSGNRTSRKTAAALPLTGCQQLLIANLYANAARNLPTLSETARDEAGWLSARPDLDTAITAADELLAGWGLDRLTGQARQHRADQIRWVLERAGDAGHREVWTLRGEPRHPSRWHQYVSDKHRRTGPGDFEARLKQVLVKAPLTDLA